MSKTTGLAAFTRKGTVAMQDAMEQTMPIRARGKGEKVALTVRLTRSEWERVHQLAAAEGVSIQTLAIEGFSRIFAEKGLPKLEE